MHIVSYRGRITASFPRLAADAFFAPPSETISWPFSAALATSQLPRSQTRDRRRGREVPRRRHRDRGQSSGTQLIQDLKNDGVLNVVEYKPPPGADKVMRLHACSDRFENGRVLVPANAPWLDDYLVELTGFPGTKHDDQVELHNPGLGLPARAGSSCDLPPGLLVGFAGAAKRASDRRTASCGNGPSEERGPASLPISAMRAPISSAPFVPREASGRRSRCRKPWHRRRINAPPPGGLGARVC